MFYILKQQLEKLYLNFGELLHTYKECIKLSMVSLKKNKRNIPIGNIKLKEIITSTLEAPVFPLPNCMHPIHGSVPEVICRLNFGLIIPLISR